MKKLTERLRRNALLDVLFSLKGNPRACIWVEPLWGIPYNLYLPYVTLFMTAIGLSYAEIGYITSITMVSQMICAVLSGVLTDKLGRRKCTVIFDTLSWSVPELLWMLSQNFTWFAVAAVFNGMWRITENSWYLLLIEDAEKDQAIALNSLSQIMGLIAAFVAPLSKFAVDAFGVVPTMRVLYGFACVSMTAKFWILYYWGTETRNGLRRMEATKNQSIFKMLWECKDIYLRIIREKRMLLTLAILSLYMLVTTLNGNYWSLYICDVLGIREGDVSLFVTFKSLVTMCCSFLLVAKIRYQSIRWPMLASLAAFALSQGLLLIPARPRARAGAGVVRRAGGRRRGGARPGHRLAGVHQRRGGRARANRRHGLRNRRAGRLAVSVAGRHAGAAVAAVSVLRQPRPVRRAGGVGHCDQPAACGRRKYLKKAARKPNPASGGLFCSGKSNSDLSSVALPLSILDFCATQRKCFAKTGLA